MLKALASGYSTVMHETESPSDVVHQWHTPTSFSNVTDCFIPSSVSWQISLELNLICSLAVFFW